MQINLPAVRFPSLVYLFPILWIPLIASAGGFHGTVLSEAKEPVVGAMVTFRFGSPFQERTVFTSDEGRYQVEGLPASAEHTIRVRRIGWHDIRVKESTMSITIIMCARITLYTKKIIPNKDFLQDLC